MAVSRRDPINFCGRAKYQKSSSGCPFILMVRILRLACTFSPSSIAIEYTDGTDAKQFKKFPVTFARFTDPRTLYDTLVSQHNEFFNSASISPGKLKHFLSEVIKRAPEVDLMNVPKEQLDKYKEQMKREFDANAIKPGDPGFVRDLRVDFAPATEPSDWD
jgi:hypothetical protein